jgi:hypothetical protein
MTQNHVRTAPYQGHALSQQSLSGSSLRCSLNAAGKKPAFAISVTMSTPNILVACKHPYLVIRKNKLDPEHALVEYNKLLIDLVNTATCFNLNIGKHGTRTKCCCLHDLQGGEDQERLTYAAEHMWHCFNLTGVNQHWLVTQWICLQDKTNKK